MRVHMCQKLIKLGSLNKYRLLSVRPPESSVEKIMGTI